MVSEPHRLILWDVDGTLMSAGPVGRTVFDAAVAHVLGRAADGHDVQMSGKTDPQIALEILATMAVSATTPPTTSRPSSGPLNGSSRPPWTWSASRGASTRGWWRS